MDKNDGYKEEQEKRSNQSPLCVCRKCLLYQQAMECPTIDGVYSYLKDEINSFGFKGFEVDLSEFVTELKN